MNLKKVFRFKWVEALLIVIPSLYLIIFVVWGILFFEISVIILGFIVPIFINPDKNVFLALINLINEMSILLISFSGIIGIVALLKIFILGAEKNISIRSKIIHILALLSGIGTALYWNQYNSFMEMETLFSQLFWIYIFMGPTVIAIYYIVSILSGRKIEKLL